MNIYMNMRAHHTHTHTLLLPNITIKQPFCYTCGMLSGIQEGHSKDRLFLLGDVWFLRWEDLKTGDDLAAEVEPSGGIFWQLMLAVS